MRRQAGSNSRNGRRNRCGTLRLLLKWYLAPGYSTELMHVFVATNLREITRGLLDDDENIEIKEMTLSEQSRSVSMEILRMQRPSPHC